MKKSLSRRMFLIVVSLFAGSLFFVGCESGPRSTEVEEGPEVIGLVSWKAKTIYVADGSSADVAQAFGVADYKASQWEVQGYEGKRGRVAVEVVPDQIDLSGFIFEAGDIRVKRGRRCIGNRPAYQSPCLKVSQGYMRYERAGYYWCKRASRRYTCKDAWVKVGDRIAYSDAACTNEVFRRPVHAWVCLP